MCLIDQLWMKLAEKMVRTAGAQFDLSLWLFPSGSVILRVTYVYLPCDTQLINVEEMSYSSSVIGASSH